MSAIRLKPLFVYLNTVLLRDSMRGGRLSIWGRGLQVWLCFGEGKGAATFEGGEGDKVRMLWF
jgi:hypothetical protein